ncbi:hypothetical protein EI94DRAFT_1707287 [Lactarius quietus]|nr:hypothetical protein EI94DRAFT_1707287 [Lactarius quietus]
MCPDLGLAWNASRGPAGCSLVTYSSIQVVSGHPKDAIQDDYRSYSTGTTDHQGRKQTQVLSDSGWKEVVLAPINGSRRDWDGMRTVEIPLVGDIVHEYNTHCMAVVRAVVIVRKDSWAAGVSHYAVHKQMPKGDGKRVSYNPEYRRAIRVVGT